MSNKELKEYLDGIVLKVKNSISKYSCKVLLTFDKFTRHYIRKLRNDVFQNPKKYSYAPKQFVYDKFLGNTDFQKEIERIIDDMISVCEEYPLAQKKMKQYKGQFYV